MAVMRQLQKQVHEENALQKSIIIMQQNSAHFEEGIVRAIQSAWQTFDEWQSRMSSTVQDTWRTLGSHMASLPPDREWISFSARSDHLLDPETPLRNPEHIQYPSKEDPSVIAVHTGHLERKKRFTRSYRESYFVLTPAGFLHEYSSSDPASTGGLIPMFSLFLPACTLGPPSPASSKSHKFHIEGRKDGTGTTKTGSWVPLTNRQHAWSFRARSREDMMEWWNDIRMLCARYLVASEQMERSGPIAAAVRSAGYASEDDDEDEDEGSSAEDEGGDDEENLYEHGHLEEINPPSYSHPERGSQNGNANAVRCLDDILFMT
jgi:PH domain